VHQASSGRHPLHAARVDDAFVTRRVAMRQLALKNESDGFKSAMRVRTKGQSTVRRRITLRPVMIQEQKRVELIERRIGERTRSPEIADVVLNGGVLLPD
jgi:hypothetical protein